MSNPELLILTDDAHDGKGPNRELFLHGREDNIMIVRMDHDKVSSS